MTEGAGVMRKTWLLVLVLVVALLALGAMGGCATIAEKAIEDATGVSVDEDGSSVTIEGDDGSTITYDEEGTELPDGYADDVPVYDGVIDSSWQTSDDNGTTYAVAIKTEDTTEDVVAWYEEQLADEGWTIKSTFKDASSGMVSAEKDDMTFYLAAGAESEGTAITQTVGPKQ